ncbi:MAG: hypothetical protein ABEJ91_03945 [Candidatus Nanohaloarchaea archaeon]
MANGPHCSDAAQRYILQEMKAVGAEAELGDVTDASSSHNGDFEWSIGEVFQDSVLRDFDPEEHRGQDLRKPEYGLRALDDVYGVVETTSDGNKRLEGLRALDIGWDFPVDGRTARDWKKNYRDAGLIDAEENVTPEGRVFLDTDPRDYHLEDTGVEDVGEVYRDLATKKVGDGGEPTGQKLEALFLYGSGMSHRDVSRATGLAYSTAKNFAYSAQDHGILSDSYRLTPRGFEFASMVVDQLDRLEAATERRIDEEHGGELSPGEIDDFRGNGYMARALAGI